MILWPWSNTLTAVNWKYWCWSLADYCDNVRLVWRRFPLTESQHPTPPEQQSLDKCNRMQLWYADCDKKIKLNLNSRQVFFSVWSAPLCYFSVRLRGLWTSSCPCKCDLQICKNHSTVRQERTSPSYSQTAATGNNEWKQALLDQTQRDDLSSFNGILLWWNHGESKSKFKTTWTCPLSQQTQLYQTIVSMGILMMSLRVNRVQTSEFRGQSHAGRCKTQLYFLCRHKWQINLSCDCCTPEDIKHVCCCKYQASYENVSSTLPLHPKGGFLLNNRTLKMINCSWIKVFPSTTP